MRNLLLTVAVLLSSAAGAKTLTYSLDVERYPEILNYIENGLCGIPRIFQMDSKQDLATEVIKNSSLLDAKLTLQTIQASKGWIRGGGLKEPYIGDYRTRVTLVTDKSPDTVEAYKFGVVQRVEIITYGRTDAPKAFEFKATLLNYRESAELAEGSICNEFSYVLK
ncbi:MAG: hypothetical protein KDD22_03965 [Bdellovibrionales bacterium]|nr:hypothetical protein [Bdellovibrionales bacterium]